MPIVVPCHRVLRTGGGIGGYTGGLERKRYLLGGRGRGGVVTRARGGSPVAPSLRAPGGEVQAHVGQRRRVPRAAPSARRGTARAVASGSASSWTPAIERRHERAHVGRLGVAALEPRCAPRRSRRARSVALGLLGRRRSTTGSATRARCAPTAPRADRAVERVDHVRDVPLSAALRLEPARRVAARRAGARTGRRARGSSGRSRSRTRRRPAAARLSSRRSATRTSARGPRAARARATIAGETSTAMTRPRGTRFEQLGGDAAGAAAGVEHRLVAAQLEPLEHRETPVELGRGDAVVGGGVPVQWRSVSHARHDSVRDHVRACAMHMDRRDGRERALVAFRRAAEW